MKNILLFIPRIICSIVLALGLCVSFVFAWILCAFGLIVFIIFYPSLRKSGHSGIFHSIFFRWSGLHSILKAFRTLWGF